MLGYARERRGYRIYDIKTQKVIEERSFKFNESLKGSSYLGKIENETWDIDSFFEVPPERNEINQNTENGVLSNFDSNNVSVEIENDNSIPLQNTSSPLTGRIQLPILELNGVQNQIPVRRSERLKSKQMSVHLANNVPNSYFEAKNSANWQNWQLAMENELDSLNKHKFAKKSTAVAANVCQIYGAIDENTCRRWFRKFREGDRSCQDLARSGWPSHVGEDDIDQVISNNPDPTVQELADTFNVFRTTPERWLVNLSFKRKLNCWVPHNLTTKQQDDQISTCVSLISLYKNDPFLTRIRTNEKWVVMTSVVALLIRLQ
ncbi:histone-lysine N-methyltransferase SETMAR [Trichonephila clavipes]|nr:histone-lysine N-methyltransferase SETMAR [Trichonephila clavipes]